MKFWNYLDFTVRRNVSQSVQIDLNPEIDFLDPNSIFSHMHSQTFWYKIQFRTTFIRSFYRFDAYFWQRWALS